MKKTKIFAVAAAVVTVLFLLITWPWANNRGGYRTVVENKLTGKMWVKFDQGMFWAGPFSDVIPYPNVVTIIATNTEVDEEITSTNPRVRIRFNDAASADAGYTVRWRLPNNEHDMLEIHKEYSRATKLAETTLQKYSNECLKYAAQLMESETHYSGGMSKLSEDFQDQLENGQFVLDYKQEYVRDSLTNEKKKITTTYVRKGLNGLPLRNKSDVQQFNITVAHASVDDVDYEKQIDKKLAEKIEASTRESISKQQLITAQQEALTAIEEGKKKIEETRARELALKEEAVIQAQKQKEVEKEMAEKARHTADKIKYEGDAKAFANRALVAAGLTPQEEKEMKIEIADRVSKNLANVKLPTTMILGGNGSQGTPLDPWTAIGLESFLNINDRIVNQSTKKR